MSEVSLPSEDISVQQPENALPPVSLGDLPDAMRLACERAGWQTLMPVQSLAMPYIMAGRDIMVQSRTGSGKTGCYLLPLLPLLDPERKETQALILVPTRELAVQVDAEARTLFGGDGIASAALYGGVGYKRQTDALKAGVQVIVGTPGRVLDHILRRTLDLETLRALVFDEADRMLSIGFYPDMKEVQRHLPRRRILTTLLSATFPPHVLKLAAEFMTEPSLLSLSQKEVHVAEVQHRFCEVKPLDKDRALVRLIETENPASAIIFCNTRANVTYVTEVLQGFGYDAEGLSSDLTQNKREAVLNRIRAGELQFLVATDVAARGIDIPELSHVFLYEPPEDHESYIHRAGRTGRAGAAGTVISLVDVMQKMELERIARHYHIDLSAMTPPTDEDVAKVAGERLTAILEARFRTLSGLERLRAARYAALARALAAADENDDNVMLLAMLLDESHQKTLRMHRPLPDGKKDADRTENGRNGRRRERGKRRRKGEGELSDAPQDAKNADQTAASSANGAQTGEDAPRRRHRRSRRRRNGGDGGSPNAPDAPHAPAAEGGDAQ
ncbi:MAG: DEAD/DEAH box helicase [Desulfovibrio sp.]|nr:DEAD/DEAH box helicase [Desulfovibrio sp.]